MAEPPIRVYVDAKVMGRHEPTQGKNSFVAYSSEEAGLHGFSRVDADQTDEAEFKAIAFAIKELKGRLQSFTVMSDNESMWIRSTENFRGLAQDQSLERY